MRKLRSDLRRLADGTKRQLGRLLYLSNARQKKSFEKMMKKLDEFNSGGNYTSEQFLSLIDGIIELISQLDKNFSKNSSFLFHQNQLELFLIQIYYQVLKYGDNKRIPDYDLSDQEIAAALDKIYRAFLKKLGETDPKKLGRFREKLEMSRLKTVVDFLVDVQKQRGLEGLLQLRDYLENLKKELKEEEEENE